MLGTAKIAKWLSLAVMSAFLMLPSSAMACGHMGMMNNTAAHVKSALDADPDLRKYDLKVEMLCNGTVRIDGTVLWIREMDRAAQIAASVYGVSKVSNVVGIYGLTDQFVVGG